MLYVRGDLHYVPRFQAARAFTVFLVPAFPRHAEKDLSAALFRAVDVPVVAAGRLEGDVCKKRLVLRGCERIQIGRSDKKLRIGGVFRSLFEYVLSFKFFFLHCFYLLFFVCQRTLLPI